MSEPTPTRCQKCGAVLWGLEAAAHDCGVYTFESRLASLRNALSMVADENRQRTEQFERKLCELADALKALEKSRGDK